MQEELGEGLGDGAGVFGRLPDDGIPAHESGHEVPGGNGNREVARCDDGARPDRIPKREQVLVGHLAGDGLPIQSAALSQEEVACVDDLLDLAERLLVGLADLPGDQPRQRLPIRFHQSPDLLDGSASDRRGDGCPPGLRPLGDPAGLDERLGVAQSNLGHHLVEPRRIPVILQAAG